jgi:hypothetical protein
MAVQVAEQVRHPIFARVYERLARTAEDRGGAEHRRFAFSPAPYLPPAPHILGAARRP